MHTVQVDVARPRQRGAATYAAAVVVWGALVWAAVVVGERLRAAGELKLGGSPPFHGWPRPEAQTWQLAPAFGLAALVVALGPQLACSVPWRRLLLFTWGGAALWAGVLASSDDLGALASPLAHEDEYLGVAESIGNPVSWLGGFAANVDTYPTHVAGHPPLPVLAFWALHAIGLTGPVPAAALCILLGSSASAAVLVTARQLLGEDRARTLAPFLVLAPYALTVATSADAMFLGVLAWGVAGLAVAASRGSFAFGVGAGVLLGATPYLNYGLLPAGALAVAVLVLRPSRRALLGTLCGGLLVVALFTAGGFWWLDGVEATHARWAFGSGSKRPYDYVLFANLALFAVITGPATAAGLARLRDRRGWLLVGAALLAVVVLDLSGVTRGEVERIWLPFAPWVMLACAGLSRGWLVPQAMVALLVQGTVRLMW